MRRLLLFTLLTIAQTVYLQANPLAKRLSLQYSSITIQNLLAKISSETGATFSYDAATIDLNEKVLINVENITVDKILQQVFKDKLCFKESGKFIIISKCKEKSKQAIQAEETTPTTRFEPLEVPKAIELHSSLKPVITYSPAYQQQLAPTEEIIKPVIAAIYILEQENARTKDTSNDDTKSISPIQVSFVYPLGSSGRKSIEKTYYLSLNMIGGKVGGVKGVELGGVLNINIQSTTGVQAAGVFNKTAKSNGAFQLAGFLNAVSEGSTSLQAAGVANLSNGDAKIQASGIANYSKGDAIIQAAGVLNKADGSSTQLAPVNITRKGGLQVGIVNVRDTTDGWMIGMLNIVKKGGLLEIELAGGDFIVASASLRTGLNQLYSIISIGVCSPSKTYAQGFGLGTRVYTKNRWSGNIEVVFNGLNSRSTTESSFGALLQTKAAISYKITNMYTLFVAPSLNTYLASESSVAPPSYSFWNSKNSKSESAMWLGFHAGIRFNLKHSASYQ